MRFHLTAILFLVAILAGEIAHSQTIQTARFICDVANSKDATVLSARVKGSDAPVIFRIHWLSEKIAPENFKNLAKKENCIISSHLIGITTVTRTILASAEADCILIHVIADQPGEVAFHARFQNDAPTQILDRRELVLTSENVHAHAWIIPFESDVEDNGKGTISVRGEGEALIVLNFSKNLAQRPIANTWTQLEERYDPKGTPPNPHLIWEAVNKTQDSETQDTRKE